MKIVRFTYKKKTEKERKICLSVIDDQMITFTPLFIENFY